MTHHINPPDPDPDRTAGLDAGGSAVPGDTPPAEGSTSGAGPQETHNPPTGWAKAPLAIILLLVVLIAGLFIVRAVTIAD
ncbi:DUF6480 family protein [Streptomyces somaliensis]|uniref:DUF6480 family protein n=1 Tax=Streptomyces somaliensis TaxID=78355 RepID=UPI0020CD27EA|nr:DUF6480 family protein [Streptomyces somaliensis]MCP9946945.1 DUF6480 family protein [Streptomyces somaliensis]MCP9976086.1 DUF6480 family protein [Streptomyces somaliensis]MCQ0021556.1 DUF6480 family protein [Streptomyces somaliensis DSM 40738]